MDPLSVTASVIALLTAATSIANILRTVKCSIKDAPQSVINTIAQVTEFQAILTMMQRFIDGVIIPRQSRLNMIQVDQLVTTLTGAVLTISELEALVLPLSTNSRSTLVESLKWSWKEDEVVKILHRLESHKASFSFMLNIAQCESDLEARESQQKLYKVIVKCLEENEELSRRLKDFENNIFESGSVIKLQLIPEDTAVSADMRENTEEDEAPAPIFESAKHHHAFEHDLNISRVYKRAALGECDTSFRTSLAPSHAWSSYSNLSLSQISNIAVIALPIFPETKTASSSSSSSSSSPLAQQISTGNALPANAQVNTNKLDWISLLLVLKRMKLQGDPSASAIQSKARPTKSTASYRLRLHVFGLDKITRLGAIDHCRDVLLSAKLPSGVLCVESETILKCMPLHYADGVLLLYNSSHRQSLDHVRQVHKQLEDIKFATLALPNGPLKQKAFITLVANGTNNPLQVPEVPTDEGKALAKEMGAKYVKASLPSSFGADNGEFSHRVLEIMQLVCNLKLSHLYKHKNQK